MNFEQFLKAHLIVRLMTKNRCYARKRTKTKGLTLHSVGCNQPTAAVFANKWDNAEATKSVHAFIDANTGDIIQTLPWIARANHLGTSTGNSYYVGVEMCEPSNIKYISGSKFNIIGSVADAQACVARTYESAVQLFAMLCVLYDLDPLTDIYSHKEAHDAGFGSGHGDPEHLWKGLYMSYTMNGFRSDVKKAIDGAAVVLVNATTVPLTAGKTVKEVQTWLNKNYGASIKAVIGDILAVDGNAGKKTKKALAIAFQVELNKLNAGLKVDGDFGNVSMAAFINKVGVLSKGSSGIFVTLWQCLLICFGVVPTGGADGKFGSATTSASNTLFSKNGLPKDSAANGSDVNYFI